MPGCYNQVAKSSKFGRHFHILAPRVILKKALQALKEAPENSHFFDATNFHRFHVHLSKLLSRQLSDQTGSDSLIKTLLLHLINHDHSLSTFISQNNTGKLKKELIDVFTQSESDTSSETEVLRNMDLLVTLKIS